MQKIKFRVVGINETIFFGINPSSDHLANWLDLRMESSGEKTLSAVVEVTAAQMTEKTEILVSPGRSVLRCCAPVLWPDHEPQTADVKIIVGSEILTTRVEVGNHRPWTIHVLSDTCSDYTWTYGTEISYLSDDVALTEAEIEASYSTASDRSENKNRYNFVVAREFEHYLKNHRDDENDKLLRLLKKGDFSLSVIPTMSYSCSQGLEEQIRQLYQMRRWEEEYGVRVCYANHQETPTIAWSMATVLAGSGVNYLVKGLLPFDTPWSKRLSEPPVFWWEGPDGSSVLYRRYNHNYVEGRFVLRPLSDIINTLERKVLPEYESYRQDYPFDIIGLVGCYGDLSHETQSLPVCKAANIAQFNNQEWEYPLLVNSSHELFWNAIEKQLTADSQIPVFKGDYGTSWEIWLVTLAVFFASWRELQRNGPVADRLFAFARNLAGHGNENDYERLTDAWERIIWLSDHAWNGSNEDNRKLNVNLRKQWIKEAREGIEATIEDAMLSVTREVSPVGESSFLVFNFSGWSGLWAITLDVDPIVVDNAGDGIHVDSCEGDIYPAQLGIQDGKPVLHFVAELPAFGYRQFVVVPGTKGSPDAEGESAVKIGDWFIENSHYRIEIDNEHGCISSLYWKSADREMVDSESMYGVHQWVHEVSGEDMKVLAVKPNTRNAGPVFGEFSFTVQFEGMKVTTSIRLSIDSDTIEFRNQVYKPVSTSAEQVYCYFPLAVPDSTFVYEAPGALVRAGETSHGGDQLPGSGQAYTAVRHIVDTHNGDVGFTLSQSQSGFVVFGHRTEDEDPVEPDSRNGTVISIALGNKVNYSEVTRDQNGETDFTFDYAIRLYKKYDPVESLKLGDRHYSTPLSMLIAGDEQGSLPRSSCNLIEIESENIVLMNTKIPEESQYKGMVVRLWNVGEKKETAKIIISEHLSIVGVFETDLLERIGSALELRGNTVEVDVPGRGFSTIFFSTEAGE